MRCLFNGVTTNAPSGSYTVAYGKIGLACGADLSNKFASHNSLGYARNFCPLFWGHQELHATSVPMTVVQSAVSQPVIKKTFYHRGRSGSNAPTKPVTTKLS